MNVAEFINNREVENGKGRLGQGSALE